jgi:putative membrane protein
MIVRGGTSIPGALWLIIKGNKAAVLLVLAIEVGAVGLHRALPGLDSTAFSAAAVGVFATVVGIFVAFRFNEAYVRWWEARILWGGMVNASRAFARQVTTLLTPSRIDTISNWDEARSLHREFVMRHLAYINALRLQLREQPVFPEIDPYLEPDEAQAMRSARNVATQLNQQQGRRLAMVLGANPATTLILNQIDTTLTAMTDDQGGMERIANTAFPDHVIAATRILVWAVAILVSVAFIEPQGRVFLLEFLAVLVVVLAFLLVRQLGEDLNDPFCNEPNDTPMTALCRTIEIDLRQQLGEEEVPEPLLPVNGVLM